MVVAGIAEFDTDCEFNFAVFAEVGAGFAAGAIEGDETCVERAEENAEGTGLARRGFGIVPCGDATRGNFGSAIGKLKLRIEIPKFFAGLRVEGEDVVIRSGEEEFSVDEDGSGFEGSFFVEIRIVREGAGMKGPSDFEKCDSGFVDLCGGRETCAA